MNLDRFSPESPRWPQPDVDPDGEGEPVQDASYVTMLTVEEIRSNPGRFVYLGEEWSLRCTDKLNPRESIVRPFRLHECGRPIVSQEWQDAPFELHWIRDTLTGAVFGLVEDVIRTDICESKELCQ